MGDANNAQLILGRPFMCTAQTRIDVLRRELSMDFDNETIKFNMFEMMRYPVDTETCFTMSTTGSIAQKYFELMKDDVLETMISQGIGVNQEGNSQAFEEISITHIDEILEQCNTLQGAEIIGERKFVLPKTSSEKQLPSVVQAP